MSGIRGRESTDLLVEKFIRSAVEWEKYPLLKKGVGIWDTCRAAAVELIRCGEGDRLIALMDDSRPAVKCAAAVLCRDIARGATRRALMEVSQGNGWIAVHAKDMLTYIFFEELPTRGP